MIHYYVYPGLEGTAIRAMRKSLASDILHKVAEEFGISILEMKSLNRQRNIVTARQIAMWMLRKFTGDSLILIAMRLNRHDHTTVIHAIKQVNNMCATEPVYKERVEKLLQSF